MIGALGFGLAPFYSTFTLVLRPRNHSRSANSDIVGPTIAPSISWRGHATAGGENFVVNSRACYAVAALRVEGGSGFGTLALAVAT
jgi:hypothetical protein